MEFLIAIRNAITGLEKQFPSLQHIADFLAGRDDAADWTGHEALGPLPEPTPAAADATEPPPPPEATDEGVFMRIYNGLKADGAKVEDAIESVADSIRAEVGYISDAIHGSSED